MDDLRLALLLNAVSPQIGGVLVRGEKGTAKSTAVRALAALLPAVDVVPACRFSCDPVAPDPGCPDGPHDHPAAATRPARLVELPVGAAEDRVVGSLDLERALGHGERAYEPGLLAAAHRGILYVDEVNLLHDHLVDLLLDAAATGRAHVEREGVSVSHPARFLLVGTMNPEEGELRPQLLDRFGLAVEVAATREPAQRAEVVRRRLAADADPQAFAARFAADERALVDRVARAQGLLPEVQLPDGALRQIAEVCAAFDVDGLRADIVTARTAVAHAAWHGRTTVGAEDVRAAARLALPHRRRRDPFDAPGLDEQALDEALRRAAEADPPEPDDEDPHRPDDDRGPDDDGGGGAPPSASDGPSEKRPEAGAGEPREGDAGPQAAPGGEPVGAREGLRARALSARGVGEGAPGRRSRARSSSTGRTTGSRRPGTQSGPLHLPATLRAAAPAQHRRGRRGGPLLLAPRDLRVAVREGREGNLVLLAVDASGSMGARDRVAAVKGAALALLRDAYQRRDKVGLVTFRGTGAELVLPPTSSVEAAVPRLQQVRTGGRTPLAEGLSRVATVLRTEALRDPRRRPLLVLVTDGRATAGPDARARALAAAVALRRAHARLSAVVVDCETGPVRLGLAGVLAAHLDAEHLPLEQLAADPLRDLVRARTPQTRSAA
ncbi:MAG: VWA domain-containing protein [Motilibacteraceae bacterium]